jgi:hypothetical protein
MQTEENKTVDIDTSGPDTEVELKEDQTTETTEAEPIEETKVEPAADVQEEKKEEPVKEEAKEEAKDEKKDELKQYSDSVQKRINNLTKRMREAERREEAALDFAKSEQSRRELLEKKLTKTDGNYALEMKARIKSGMEAAIAKLAKAKDENNLQDEVAATAEISRLGYEEARLKDIESSKPAIEKEVVAPQTQARNEMSAEAVQSQPVDPRAQEWLNNNQWFNSDPIMREAAKVIHTQLVDGEGFDPVSDANEYYSEINKRIRLEFPQKFATPEQTTAQKPTQTVASATRSSKSGRKIVKLTPSQTAIARKLGVPLEEYAKQLKLTKEA